MTRKETRSLWNTPEFQQRRVVDLLCREFEQQWNNGNHPAIESVVAEAPEEVRETLLQELIAIEWELSERAGNAPSLEAYRVRFPAHEDQLFQLAFGLGETAHHSSAASLKKLPEPGDEFAGFRIVRRLGSGGMGTVFLAEIPAISHLVALKILESPRPLNTLLAARFEREARLLSRLNHPGIVPLYSYGEYAGLQYLVMKAIPGVCLETILWYSHKHSARPEADLEEYDLLPIARWINDPNADGRIPLLLDLAIQIAEALRAVHSTGILHRDIKPSNILISGNGRVFLTDFGLARDEQNDDNLTRGGEFVGTLRYSAPETLDGKHTQQSDLYSLGLVLFELFSLRIPFTSDSRQELLRLKLSGTIPEMASANHWAPAAIRSIIRRLTRPSSLERTQSADELVSQLTACRLEFSRTQFSTSKISVRATVTIGLAAVLLVVVVLAYLPSVRSARVHSSQASGADPAHDTKVAAIESNKTVNMSPYSHVPWLEFRNSIATPPNHSVQQLTVNQTGIRLMALTDHGSLLMADSNASEFTLTGGNSLRSVHWIALSDDGSTGLIAGRDARRPGIDDAEHRTDFFVEGWSPSDGVWIRIGGPPFKLQWGVPRFINGLDPQLTPFVFVPDVKLPTVWHPAGRGFVQVPFPGGDDRVAVAIYDFTAAAVDANGKLEIIFNTQLDENQEPLKRQIDTSLGECRVLRFSPDGQWILMAGTTEIALVSMADSSVKKLDHDWDDLSKIIFSGDSRYVVVSHSQRVNLLDVAECAWIGEVTTTSPIICVSPFSSGAAVFSVEQSGRIAVTDFNSGEARTTLEASGPDLTTAAFTEAENCLVVALQFGGVAVFKVRNNPEGIRNHATDIGAAQ